MQITLTGEAERLALEAVTRGESPNVDAYVEALIVDRSVAYDLTEEQEAELERALADPGEEFDGPSTMRELIAGIRRAS